MCSAGLCILNQGEINEHLPTMASRFFVTFKRGTSKPCNGALIRKGYALGVKCDALNTRRANEIQVIINVLSHNPQTVNAVSRTEVPNSNYLLHIRVRGKSLNSRLQISIN